MTRNKFVAFLIPFLFVIVLPVAIIGLMTTSAMMMSGPTYPARTFSIVTYDGHKWVKFSGMDGGGLAHHPDCPCGEDER